MIASPGLTVLLSLLHMTFSQMVKEQESIYCNDPPEFLKTAHFEFQHFLLVRDSMYRNATYFEQYLSKVNHQMYEKITSSKAFLNVESRLPADTVAVQCWEGSKAKGRNSRTIEIKCDDDLKWVAWTDPCEFTNLAYNGGGDVTQCHLGGDKDMESSHGAKAANDFDLKTYSIAGGSEETWWMVDLSPTTSYINLVVNILLRQPSNSSSSIFMGDSVSDDISVWFQEEEPDCEEGPLAKLVPCDRILDLAEPDEERGSVSAACMNTSESKVRVVVIKASYSLEIYEVIVYGFACPSGFTGVWCETDYNECASNPCQNNSDYNAQHSCHDAIGRWICVGERPIPPTIVEFGFKEKTRVVNMTWRYILADYDRIEVTYCANKICHVQVLKQFATFLAVKIERRVTHHFRMRFYKGSLLLAMSTDFPYTPPRVETSVDLEGEERKEEITSYILIGVGGLLVILIVVVALAIRKSIKNKTKTKKSKTEQESKRKESVVNRPRFENEEAQHAYQTQLNKVLDALPNLLALVPEDQEAYDDKRRASLPVTNTPANPKVDDKKRRATIAPRSNIAPNTPGPIAQSRASFIPKKSVPEPPKPTVSSEKKKTVIAPSTSGPPKPPVSLEKKKPIITPSTSGPLKPPVSTEKKKPIIAPSTSGPPKPQVSNESRKVNVTHGANVPEPRQVPSVTKAAPEKSTSWLSRKFGSKVTKVSPTTSEPSVGKYQRLIEPKDIRDDRDDMMTADPPRRYSLYDPNTPDAPRRYSFARPEAINNILVVESDDRITPATTSRRSSSIVGGWDTAPTSRRSSSIVAASSRIRSSSDPPAPMDRRKSSVSGKNPWMYWKKT